MYYNILWYSQSSDRDTSFVEILNHAKPDILVVSELSNAEGDAKFYKDVILKFNPSFSKGRFHESNNGRNGCDLNIYFDSTQFSLINQTFIASSPRDHALYDLLSSRHDTIHVIGSHLKASNSAEDIKIRAESINHLFEYIAEQKISDNLIYGGDLNFYGGTEPAYSTLIKKLNLFDPLGNGDWHDNIDFSEIHTQSTRKTGFGGGGLDDRFDFILISQDFLNHKDNIKYIEGSYRDVGNDGNHLNKAITDGENDDIPKDLVNHLFAASDHIPVLIKIKIKR